MALASLGSVASAIDSHTVDTCIVTPLCARALDKANLNFCDASIHAEKFKGDFRATNAAFKTSALSETMQSHILQTLQIDGRGRVGF